MKKKWAGPIRPYNVLESDDGKIEITMYGEVVESRPVDFWTGKPVDGLLSCFQTSWRT